MGQAAKKKTELSPEKRRQIIDGAHKAFIELGYERASVNTIAAQAGVSKATLYNHFSDKAALFSACIEAMMEAAGVNIFGLIAAAPADNPERDLLLLGGMLLRHMLSPPSIAVHRVAIAEAPPFPELGRAFYRAGIEAGRRRMAGLLDQFVARGDLRIDDTAVAADHFFDLCTGDALRRVLLGVVHRVSEKEIRQAAERGVRTFLAAYRA